MHSEGNVPTWDSDDQDTHGPDMHPTGCLCGPNCPGLIRL